MFRTGRDHKSRGQSLVELALVLPLAVLILALSADFGRAFTAYIQVGSAAREGAMYGMQSQQASNDVSGMTAAVIAESPKIWGVAPTVNFPESDCTDGMTRPDGSEYDCVVVEVTHQFQPIITIWPIPDTTIPIVRRVKMRVVN